MRGKCFQCGEVWEEKHTPGLREECLGCAHPWHCCANCKFYDASSHEWCREPVARDRKPKDPEQANTCEWFLLNEAGEGETPDNPVQAKKDLAALFGDAPTENAPAETPDWMKSETPGKTGKDIFGKS